MTIEGASPPSTDVQRCAQERLDSDPDVTPHDLACEVPFSLDSADDSFAAWHPETRPFEPIVRALFLRELNEWNDAELIEALASDPDLAAELGFSEATPPENRSTFNRAWRNRLSEALRIQIQRDVAWIQTYIRAVDHPLATRVLAPEDGRGDSRRSESRLIREKLDTVPDTMVGLVASEWDFIPQRAANTQYHLHAFLETECTMGVTRTAAEQGAEIYGDDTPREGGGPSGDTMLHYIKQLEMPDILERFHSSSNLMMERASQYLGFDRLADVAIDYTEIPYYGSKTEIASNPWIHDVSGNSKKEYRYCYRYGAVAIVGDNVKFFLGVRPIHEDDSHGVVVEELLERAREHVSIATVYADREFAAADVLHTLHQYPVEYVIPVPLNHRIKQDIGRMTTDIEVTHEYGFYGNVRSGATNERVETIRVLLPSTKSEEDEAGTVAFYTNVDVDDTTEADREQTERIINQYRRRWGIENSFKSLKTFLPWTTSNEPIVRIFHFVFGVMLYNLWRIIDFLIQQTLEDYAVRMKPRLKAKRFINALESKRLLA